MNKTAKALLLSAGIALLAGLCIAQRSPRELPPHAINEETRVTLDLPVWTNPPAFQKDVFTFVRIKYSVSGKYGFGHDPLERWQIDSPDSDINFSYRLQQMTSMKVNPDGLFLELTDKELFNYPFIYIVEPGRLTFTDEEVPILRKYLLNGGFLMADDFWGETAPRGQRGHANEWGNFHQEMKRVFPDRDYVELDLTHAIFHCVFDLKAKPQVPGLPHAQRNRGTGITWEREDAKEPHYRAFFDDKGRMCAILCHNTDFGDGWEREGQDEAYFHEFSEKQAFPMGINIIFYAMTH
ncbi:MAG TPA: DUF4159 domain-containing protein [Verrucomicrobiae bacterium]|jgi:hypothetical protein